jgi:hypothetical protein
VATVPECSDGASGRHGLLPNIGPVSLRVFLLAALVQALAVGALFGILVALPLRHSFFEDWGFVVGPAAWIACALVTGAVLRLPWTRVAGAAVLSGAAAALLTLAGAHAAGMIAAVVVFAAACAAGARSREERPAAGA